MRPQPTAAAQCAQPGISCCGSADLPEKRSRRPAPVVAVAPLSEKPGVCRLAPAPAQQWQKQLKLTESFP